MKLFLIIFAVIILFLFTAPMVEDVFNAATVLGIIGGIIPLTLGILWNVLNASIKIPLTVIYFIGFVILLYLMVAVLNGGKTNADKQKLIIVLGCSVKGEKASLSLLRRVDSAYDFLIKNPEAVAILSGGQGKGEKISEADCMFRLLREKGISENRLILEDKSTSTDENIKFSLDIIKKFNLQFKNEAAIATSEYHQLRAKMICRRYGLKAYAQSSRTKLIILPTFLLREIPAIIKEKLTNCR